MEHPTPLPLLVSLPRPSRGTSTRIQIGSHEVVLEAVRGGHAFLWSNGRQARRYMLGLGPQGHLTLQLRAPALPVRVVPRDVVTVVPGGRVAGYVQVSLVPTLVWHDENGGSRTLVEVLPDDLAAEWDEQAGHTLHGGSPWFSRFPMRNGEPRAVVPVRIANQGPDVLTPPHLDLRLHDAELVSLRGSVVVAPRRLRWSGARLLCEVRSPSRAGVPA